MLGALVRTHRRRLGLSQEDLADRAGISVRTIGKIETGRIVASRPSTLRLLAEAFRLTADQREQLYRATASPGWTSCTPPPGRPPCTAACWPAQRA